MKRSLVQGHMVLWEIKQAVISKTSEGSLVIYVCTLYHCVPLNNKKKYTRKITRLNNKGYLKISTIPIGPALELSTLSCKEHCKVLQRTAFIIKFSSLDRLCQYPSTDTQYISTNSIVDTYHKTIL
jgi:hypothetical protein